MKIKKIKTAGIAVWLALFFCLPVHAEAPESAAETALSPTPPAAVPKTEKLLSAPSADKSDSNYRIQSGDKLQIKIYPEDPYVHGGEMEVTPEGNVTLPLIGKIKLAGKTINEASAELQTIIDRDYLANPEVVIQIMGFKQQSFVILGQVRKPGTYEFPPGSKTFTFLQAMSLAGGFSEVANIKKVRIVRQEDGQRKIIRLNAEQIISGEDTDPELMSGDVINVSESLF